MREELCNTRLCAYAYVGYKRPGFVCGTPLHDPRDGEYTLALRSRCATLIGSLRRQHEGKFTDRKLRIDAQRIAATQASPRPVVSYREHAIALASRSCTVCGMSTRYTTLATHGPTQARPTRSWSPIPQYRTPGTVCAGREARSLLGTADRPALRRVAAKVFPPATMLGHTRINLGSAYAVQGTQHQESGSPSASHHGVLPYREGDRGRTAPRGESRVGAPAVVGPRHSPRLLCSSRRLETAPLHGRVYPQFACTSTTSWEPVHRPGRGPRVSYPRSALRLRKRGSRRRVRHFPPSGFFISSFLAEVPSFAASCPDVDTRLRART